MRDHKSNFHKSANASQDMQHSKLEWDWTKDYGHGSFPVQFLCLFCVYILLVWFFFVVIVSLVGGGFFLVVILLLVGLWWLLACLFVCLFH